MFNFILIFSFFICLVCRENYIGIDISEWQGPDIDFEKIKEAGINFVIIRAGIGDTLDIYWELNYKKAKAAGLNVGAYWYSKAFNEQESQKEAEYTLNAIEGKQLEYPIYYVIEQREILAKGKSFCSTIATIFSSHLERNKKFCGIYSSKSNLELYFDEDVKRSYSIWVAQYESICTYSGDYGIWQKSNKGDIVGLPGDINLDISIVNFPPLIKGNHRNGF